MVFRSTYRMERSLTGLKGFPDWGRLEVEGEADGWLMGEKEAGTSSTS